VLIAGGILAPIIGRGLVRLFVCWPCRHGSILFQRHFRGQRSV